MTVAPAQHKIIIHCELELKKRINRIHWIPCRSHYRFYSTLIRLVHALCTTAMFQCSSVHAKAIHIQYATEEHVTASERVVSSTNDEKESAQHTTEIHRWIHRHTNTPAQQTATATKKMYWNGLKSQTTTTTELNRLSNFWGEWRRIDINQRTTFALKLIKWVPKRMRKRERRVFFKDKPNSNRVLLYSFREVGELFFAHTAVSSHLKYQMAKLKTGINWDCPINCRQATEERERERKRIMKWTNATHQVGCEMGIIRFSRNLRVKPG